MPTDTEDRCALTELPKSGCAHCRGESRPAPAADPDTFIVGVDVGVPFVARFPGRCAACGDRIGEGDVIAKVLDDDGFACSRHLP